MANRTQIVNVEFLVAGADGVNDDGTLRQDILKYYFEHDEEEQILQFNRGELRENGQQIISVTVNKKKIGEISTEDYELYEEMITRAKGGMISIFRNTDSADTCAFGAKAILAVSYKNSRMEKIKLKRRKRITVFVLAAVSFLLAVRAFLMGDVMSGIIELICTAGFMVWALIIIPKQSVKSDPADKKVWKL